MKLAQCTLEQYEKEFQDRHHLHRVISGWAAVKPEAAAIVHANTGREISWGEFERFSTGLAMQLTRLGFRKGDFFATSLPFLPEHIFLEYACFKIGVIHAPLDLRLSPAEVIRCLGLIRAKGYAFLGQTKAADFRELGRAVAQHCPFVEHRIQFSAPGETIEGAQAFHEIAGAAGQVSPELAAAFREALMSIGERDGAQVIFTTGSTGAPKPALLSHRSITCQNMCLGAAFEFNEKERVLVNLPPSHVGGQTEALMTTLFWGGTAIVLDVFDPSRSLEAIQKHGVTLLGQIPAMFNFEWRLPDFGTYDISSLKFAIYGGQQVTAQFLARLDKMAPRVGTGLGLTESAGFCTYTPPGVAAAELQSGLGFDMPVYPVSVRAPMREDGRAGESLPDGEIGQICFRGPQTFSGYVNDPQATARTISSDGYLYTGDMGYKDGKGLQFSGRSKWVIKPAGYQVFPGDVENHFCALQEKVGECGAVGIEHRLISEGIVAFVEKKPGAGITVKELRQHAKALTSYMRPMHFVLLEPGQMPLNRIAKVDYLRLQEMARAEVDRLRSRGGWDC